MKENRIKARADEILLKPAAEATQLIDCWIEELARDLEADLFSQPPENLLPNMASENGIRQLGMIGVLLIRLAKNLSPEEMVGYEFRMRLLDLLYVDVLENRRITSVNRILTGGQEQKEENEKLKRMATRIEESNFPNGEYLNKSNSADYSR